MADNENYDVTEDGILMHNRYGKTRITQADCDELRAWPSERFLNSFYNE